MSAEEQGECEQVISLEEERRGSLRTSSGLVSTQQPNKLKRVSSPVGHDAMTPGVRGSESLLTIAKREAAKRMLYSKFYRGEVLKSEYEEAVVPIKGGVDDESEGGEKRRKKRKKKRKRGEGEGEEDEEGKKTKKKDKGGGERVA